MIVDDLASKAQSRLNPKGIHVFVGGAYHNNSSYSDRENPSCQNCL